MPIDAASAVMFHLVIVSDAINDFLPGDNKDLSNWLELNWIDVYN